MTEFSQEQLKEFVVEIDKWGLALLQNMGKSTAECDDNDMVFIRDGNGHIRLMMSLEDYQDILEYGKENSIEKRTC